VVRLLIADNDLPEARILHSPSASVTVFDDDLRLLIEDLWDTMESARGVGLAAPQIGVPLRVAVIDTKHTDSSHRKIALVNPTIIDSSGSQLDQEGCLSLPGLSWPITRPNYVRVTYQDENGLDSIITGRGLLARALVHETEHLQGILCNSIALKSVPQ